MRSFLYKVALFLLPLFLIAYPLDYFLSYYLSQSKESPAEFEVWDDIYGSKIDCDVAIYGSSRAWVQFSPSILGDTLSKRVYNFGIDGQTFWLQYLRHLEFLKNNKPPQTIILSVDIFSLNKGTRYNNEQFLPYMLWNQNMRKFVDSDFGYSALDYYIPMLRYAGKVKSLKRVAKSICKRYPENFRFNGYRGMDIEWKEDFEKTKATTRSYSVSINEEVVNLLEEFIQSCTKLGIRLILVYAPDYIEGQQFISNRDQILSLYTDISKKYNIVFLDFSNDDICMKKEYFYNATHLNRKGAELFSQKLASMLKKHI